MDASKISISVLEAESPGETELALPARHCLRIERSASEHTLHLVCPDGSVPITIHVGSHGVTLRVNAPSIALEASGDLSISAERLRLEGRSGLTLQSQADVELSAQGDLYTRAAAQRIVATRGGLALKASDDVMLNGERVMVNCDERAERYFKPVP